MSSDDFCVPKGMNWDEAKKLADEATKAKPAPVAEEPAPTSEQAKKAPLSK